ncbi:pilus assembly PilX family protein [Janthinobacterium sp. Mn2066]|uniref:pilus assembly PilX family protein n=1 Tax=Janthinobacterium sp. Mn2066 TaxID=3395264 RepID=UPI003BE693B3
MPVHQNALASRPGQRGVALVFTLCLLLVILLLGVSAAQMALLGEKAARGERDRHTAFHAAEEALMDAERDIEGQPAAPGRSAMFAPDSAAGFAADCGEQPGLCLPATGSAPPVWLVKDLAADDEGVGTTVAYGRFTGAAMQTGQGFLPFRRPRYLIELLPFHAPGEEAGAAAPASYLYRVTAIGFGANGDTQVVLQTYYRKQPAGVAP